MSDTEIRTSFFRQSGWMMIATFTGGLFMFAVHVFAPFMPEREYGLFTTLLQILNLMMIPAIGLQTTFAHQAAAAVTDTAQRQLRGTTRAVLLWTFLIWMATAALASLFQQPLMATLKISNPAALWMTVALGLPQLWLPVMLGLLQGRQNFLWLGWTSILNGLGRFLAVALFVAVLGGHAAGAITGAWTGLLVGFLVGAWHCRGVWGHTGDPFDGREWLRRIVPLTLGLGAGQFMLAADMIVVRSAFDQQTGLYGAAGMVGRGLVVFTAPLAVVVFPKIVHSRARSQSTNVLGKALLGTGVLGCLAALGCTICALALPGVIEWIAQGPAGGLLGPLRERWVTHRDLLAVVFGLVPWFVWGMLPFALANVLIFNLLARERYHAVPWLVAVALAYAGALTLFHGSFLTVVRLIALFALVLLGVALWFSRHDLRTAMTPVEPPGQPLS